jgi:uncharacterized protein (TIGR02444 family)
MGRIEFDQEHRFMKSPRTDLEADCWAFALEGYARPAVTDACLELQNQAGVDVMMLLVIAFATVRLRIVLTPAEIGELAEVCRPWREQIVWPLRAIRSGLKTGPSPAPCSQTEQFRSKIKTVEIAAERLQNQLLVQCLPLRTPGKDAVDPDELRSVLRTVVAQFLGRRGSKPDTNLLSAIDAIADAVMQGAR